MPESQAAAPTQAPAQSSAPKDGGNLVEGSAKPQTVEKGQPQAQAAVTPEEQRIIDLQKEKAKYRVRAGEEEYELADLIKGHQTRSQVNKAADQKFQEAAKVREQQQLMQRAMLEDPVATLLAMGVPQDRVRETFEKWYKAQFIDPEQMSPQERALAEREKAIADRERQQRMLAEQENQRQVMAKAKILEQQWTKGIMEGFEQKGWKANELLIKRVGEQLQAAAAAEIDPSAALSLAVDRVIDDMGRESQFLLGRMEGKQLLGFLGKTTIDKIMKAKLEELRGPQAEPPPTQAAAAPGGIKEGQNGKRYLEPPKERERLGVHEWRAQFPNAGTTMRNP